MKRFISVMTVFLLSSCSGWFFQPSPYNPPTPFLPSTSTPSIVTPTPAVVEVQSATPDAATTIPVATNTPFSVATDAPTETPLATATVGVPSISVEVLGCNTSLDVTHGMGEVTNAFITLKNSGTTPLTNVGATLSALDEGREHPDKTMEVTSIPIGYEVTLKLTVDSTYRAETPIQIEVAADGGLFHRVGAESCRNIGLFAPSPASLLTPMPSQ
jgi:hypothetical protein